jgi:hypothetical protein
MSGGTPLAMKEFSMAYYKYAANLEQEPAAPEYDLVYHPATSTPYSGVYKCQGCGREAVSTYGHALPPQNHHQHTPSQGTIRWRLIAKSMHR